MPPQYDYKIKVELEAEPGSSSDTALVPAAEVPHAAVRSPAAEGPHVYHV